MATAVAGAVRERRGRVQDTGMADRLLRSGKYGRSTVEGAVALREARRFALGRKTTSRTIVDTSALIVILRDEAVAPALAMALQQAPARRMSAANDVEAGYSDRRQPRSRANRALRRTPARGRDRNRTHLRETCRDCPRSLPQLWKRASPRGPRLWRLPRLCPGARNRRTLLLEGRDSATPTFETVEI